MAKGKGNGKRRGEEFVTVVEQRELALLRDTKLQHDLQPLMKEAADNILTLMAQTPMSWWPPMVALAFHHAERRYPALGRMYREAHAKAVVQ